ncbi:MAG: DUF3311 domain-containing protein [Candidatus Marsarchaeota archaeon]|jgi:hypothetical protein|nr:DUF3311 domain-containing protein [Candidatus Marsarchaeota archaeon]
MVRSVDIAIAILLLIPLIALLAIPTYNHINPTIGGLSFFYWYQMLWMPLSAILFYIAAVLWNRRERDDEAKEERRSKRRRR